MPSTRTPDTRTHSYTLIHTHTHTLIYKVRQVSLRVIRTHGQQTHEGHRQNTHTDNRHPEDKNSTHTLHTLHTLAHLFRRPSLPESRPHIRGTGTVCPLSSSRARAHIPWIGPRSATAGRATQRQRATWTGSCGCVDWDSGDNREE